MYFFLGDFTNSKPNSNSKFFCSFFSESRISWWRESYKNELFKMIHGYIDMSKYAVNGVFVFSFDIDEDGRTKN
jgi:hypothetical protein